MIINKELTVIIPSKVDDENLEIIINKILYQVFFLILYIYTKCILKCNV